MKVAYCLVMSTQVKRNDSLKLLSIVEDLPSLPDQFFQIQKVIDNPASEIDDLINIIRTDQSVTLMVLKCANSAYYNPRGQPIGDLPQAIARIGFRNTAHIAMSISLIYGLAIPSGIANIRRFWVHAFAVGLMCEHMGKLLKQDSEELFIIGLLHDIGRVAISMRIDLSYFENRIAKLPPDERLSHEREAYGLDHAEAGAELLRLWNFPEKIYKSVLEHHQTDSSLLPARICRLANQEAHKRLKQGINIDMVESEIMGQFSQDAIDLLQQEGLLQK